MADLSTEAKLFIVQSLARFSSPAEVVAMIYEEFGVETSVQQVRTYNPEHPKYEAGEKWRPIFDAVRKAYLENLSSIPIASKAFRLHALQKNYERATKMSNLILANATLEQAAKEVGGFLTNERNIKLEKSETGFRDLSPEERRTRVTEMLREAILRGSSENSRNSSTNG